MVARHPDDRGGLSDLERHALAALDTDDLVADLIELVARPSCDGHESAAQRTMAAIMQSAGLEVDLWPIDLDVLRRHPSFSWEIERDEALGLVGITGGGPAGRRGDPPWAHSDGTSRTPAADGGRDLILNGHIDVVPAADAAHWTSPPFEPTVRDGAVFGRGAVDMKGGLACAVAAARTLRDAGIRLHGRLLIESVAGEEDGGLGTLAALERGYRADAAVVVEPSDLTIVAAQAGCLGFRLTVPGKAAHGALRWEGVSALERFLPIHDALLALESSRTADALPPDVRPLFADYPKPYPLSIGTVRAGSWPSTVPEDLVCEGRYGVMPGEDARTARRRFEEAVAAAASTDGRLPDQPPVVEWPGGQYASALTSLDESIVQTIIAGHDDLFGRRPTVAGVTYGADMGLLSSVGGIPTVIYGPGDVALAHQADEHVRIADLEAAVRALIVLVMRFCGTGEA